MKHFYLAIFLVVCCSVARAQVNKGDIVLGGNIGYSEQSSTGNGTNATPPPTSDYHDLYINPSVGKAIRNDLVLGIDFMYMHSISSGTYGGQPTGTNETNSLQAGIFLRRYRPLGNSGFYLFGQTELAFAYSHSSAGDLPPNTALESDKSNGYKATLQLYPGIAYALDRHWQIETGLPNFFSITYNHNKSESVYSGQPEIAETNHSFDINTSLTGNNQFTVGVRYIIGG